MRSTSITIIGIFLVFAIGVSNADTGKFQKAGFISNGDGEKCWYQQRVIDESTHFHGTMTSTIGEIVFDDAKCMSDTGMGMDLNQMMINNIISRWYSHSDANFDTRNLYKSSMAQKKGQCIQSKTYPIIGITVEYIVTNGSIVKVLHGPSLQGCTN